MSEEKIFNPSEDTSTPIKKKRSPGRPRASRTLSSDNKIEEKMERQLTDIYKDDSGRMPDMRKIKKVQGGSFLSGLLKFLFTIALLAAIAWVGFFFLPMANIANKFSESQLDLKIVGPQNFTIGSTTTYQIILKNNQKNTLNNVTLSTNYPSGFVFSQSSIQPNNAGKNEWGLEPIRPQEERTIQITGNLFGSLGQEQSWRVFLNYTPDNLKSEMQKVATLNIRPDQAPLNLTLSGIDKISLDTESSYTITIESKDNLSNKNLIVSPIFPPNFSLSSSSIALEKNVWNIKANTSTENTQIYKINFSGKFNATEENTVPIKVQVKLASTGNDNFLLAESTINTELIKNAVTLNTAINGSLTDMESKPGDTLNFTLALKNFGKTDIENAQVKIMIEGPSYKKQSVLSWSDISDKHDGDIVGSQISDTIRSATISWNNKKIADLKKIKAGGEVLVDFQLPIKNSNKAPWNEIINNQIKITAQATFVDLSKTSQTISANPITITLNSDLSFQVKNDVGSNEKELETHDITWILNNTFHPLKNLSISADIYGDVIWIGPSSTSAGTVQFDPKTKHLVWNIPEMTENTDVLALPFTIVINKKNPTQNTLVSKVHIIADDTVSNKKLELLGDEIPLNN
jgi:uncharacterized repeat protein (TIGR01451 family)